MHSRCSAGSSARRVPFPGRVLMAFTLGLLLTACSRHAESEPLKSNDGLRPKVVGTWLLDERRQGDFTISGLITFGTDGNSTSTWTVVSPGGTNEWSYESTWWIDGKVITSTVTRASGDKHEFVGQSTRFEISSLDDHEMVYQAVSFANSQTVRLRRKE